MNTTDNKSGDWKYRGDINIADIKSDEQLRDLYFNYLELKTEVEGLLNKRLDRDDYLKLFEEKEYSEAIRLKEIIRRFREILGVEDIFYAVTDQEQDSVHIFKNREIDERHQGKLLLLLEPELYQHEVDTKAAAHKEMLDLMYESEEEFIKLLSHRGGGGSPYYLRNLPPYVSAQAVKMLPFEEKWREKKTINYMYAYVGESIFFTYLYTYLIDLIRFNREDFNGKLNKIDPEIRNERISDFQIWELENWQMAGYEEMPEMRWLKVIEKRERFHHYAATGHLDRIKRNWVDFIENNESVRVTDGDFDFRLERWAKLGVRNKSDNYQERLRVSLLSYAVHVLKNSNYSLWLRTKILPKVPLEVRKKISPLLDMDFDHDHDHAKVDTKIKAMVAGWENDEACIHYLVVLVGLQMILPDQMKMNQEIKFRELLSALHLKSRFTLFQSFFQSVLSSYELPLEHYYFPVHKSLKYSTKFRLNENDLDDKKLKKENEHSQSTPFVCVCCATLTPVWKLQDDYNITKSDQEGVGKDYLFEQDPEISTVTLLRLQLVSDFVRLLSGSFIDDFFYGELVEREKSYHMLNKQFETQGHESKRLIDLINSNTNSEILEDVRLYFNIVFQRARGVVREKIKGNKQNLPPFFYFGDNYEDLVNHACLTAVQIQFIADKRFDESRRLKANYRAIDKIARKKKIIDEQKQWDIHYQRKRGIFNLLTEHNIKSTVYKSYDESLTSMIYSMGLQKIEEAMVEELSRQAFFFMAVVCGVRNALKHRQPTSQIKVRIEGEDRMGQKIWITIVNEKKAEKPEQNDLQKMGSTVASLEYYVASYLGENFLLKTGAKVHRDAFFFNDSFNQKFYKTYIPLPVNSFNDGSR